MNVVYVCICFIGQPLCWLQNKLGIKMFKIEDRKPLVRHMHRSFYNGIVALIVLFICFGLSILL
jgi:hypothetical protein